MRLVSLSELIQWFDEESLLPNVHENIAAALDGEEIREIDARSIQQ